MPLNTIEEAIADIAAGKAVVVVDDESRENEGDLVFAAEHATPELLAFMVRYTSGYICAPVTDSEADRLDLPPMHHTNQDVRGTAYTVSVDASEGISTGISAADRARTIRLLSSPDTRPTDLRRPGHVVPLRARAQGVLVRPGQTWPGSPAAVPRACSARSSTTTAPWPGCRSWRSSPRSTTSS
jgi:3,4-dihydroxy 2-butanone 4-phosphate synthase/GTP cyclohydrolase II